MPTKLQSDPNCNEKKKHIGNDYVNIIYNESGEEYNLNTISVSCHIFNIPFPIHILNSKNILSSGSIQLCMCHCGTSGVEYQSDLC